MARGRSRLTLRARLTIGVLVLLVAVFAAMGIAMARSTESALIAQTDQQIKKQAERVNKPPEKAPEEGDSATPASAQPKDNNGGNGGGGNFAGGGGGGGNPEGYPGGQQTLATFIIDSQGNILYSSPSGYSDDPDSPPAIPAPGTAEFDQCQEHITTVSSESGSIQYRLLISPTGNEGTYSVVAAPLDNVHETVSSLVKRFIGVGLAGLAIAALAVWWVIRKEFQPVDTMVDTAAAIAGGDLSRRVPEGDARTELGRLGEALNDMLSQIEQGLNERDRNEQRLRRFVADAAHELRTPLTSVRGYSELYRQGAYPDEAAVDHAMARIESEGSRMARLVDDLLLLARMDQQRPLEQRPMDLVSLANEAATDYETVTTDHPLNWEPEGEVIVRGDPIRLRQVIDNLLGNARSHTPAGTHVEMSVNRVGNNAQIVIADDGPGIAPADRERVFERFWRADSSRTRNTGGSGLGLAIVQSLVQAHGGSVSLDSEPGRGSRFTIQLPVIAGSAAD